MRITAAFLSGIHGCADAQMQSHDLADHRRCLPALPRHNTLVGSCLLTAIHGLPNARWTPSSTMLRMLGVFWGISGVGTIEFPLHTMSDSPAGVRLCRVSTVLDINPAVLSVLCRPFPRLISTLSTHPDVLLVMEYISSHGVLRRGQSYPDGHLSFAARATNLQTLDCHFPCLWASS